MKIFSSRKLIQRREVCGLSREDLAVAIGRSYWSVSGYEIRGIEPPLRVLRRIAEALDCDVVDLLENATDVSTTAVPS